MVKVSKAGEGVTLYIPLSVFPAGKSDTANNLTISCSVEDMKFKTTLSDKGLIKFKEHILSAHKAHIKNKA